MGFVNEHIPPEDKVRHGITESNHFYRAGHDSWAVDREREMFLMLRDVPGPEGTPGRTGWAFFWRGRMLDVGLQLLAMGGDPHGGHGWAHERVLYLRGLSNEQERHAALRDLKDALIAHKGVMGIRSRRTSYDVILEDTSGVRI